MTPFNLNFIKEKNINFYNCIYQNNTISHSVLDKPFEQKTSPDNAWILQVCIPNHRCIHEAPPWQTRKDKIQDHGCHLHTCRSVE